MYNILKGGIFTCPINLLLLIYFLNITIILHKIKEVNKMLVSKFKRGVIDRNYPFDMRIIGNTIYVLSLPLVAINTLDLIKDSNISRCTMIDIIYGRGCPSYEQLSSLAVKLKLNSAGELINYDIDHDIPHMLNTIDPFNIKLEYLENYDTPQLMNVEFRRAVIKPIYVTSCEYQPISDSPYTNYCAYRSMTYDEFIRNPLF